MTKYIGADPYARTVASTVSAGALNRVTTFTTSGTYTPYPGVTKILVHVVGGGGGGGAAGTTMSGSGGGAGGYNSSLLSVVFGTAYAVVVGTGGASATAGIGSSFTGAVTVIANGGSAGVSNTVNGAGGAGGAAGSPTGTIISIAGGAGDPPFSTTRPGMGGDSAFLNGGGRTKAVAGVGNAGIANTGGGGGGGHTSANAGGAGGDGIVIIYEYGIFI